jgi:hypothetical protein
MRLPRKDYIFNIPTSLTYPKSLVSVYMFGSKYEKRESLSWAGGTGNKISAQACERRKKLARKGFRENLLHLHMLKKAKQLLLTCAEDARGIPLIPSVVQNRQKPEPCSLVSSRPPSSDMKSTQQRLSASLPQVFEKRRWDDHMCGEKNEKWRHNRVMTYRLQKYQRLTYARQSRRCRGVVQIASSMYLKKPSGCSWCVRKIRGRYHALLSAFRKKL